MPTKEFYSLTDDVCFKHLLKNKLFLEDFLNSLFAYLGEAKKVLAAKITTNKEMLASSRKKKIFYGDVLAYLDSDEIVSIEMYKNFQKKHFSKSLSYNARIYSDQLERGKDYTGIKKVIGINIIDNNHYFKNNYLLSNYSFINRIDNKVIDNNFIDVLVIRLDIVSKIVYNVKEVRILRWLHFIAAKSLEEMRKIAKGDDVMEQALSFMESFLNDEHIRDVYDKINDVKEDAKEEGMAQGKRENAIKTAQNLLSTSLSIEEIAKATGLTIKEVEALK